MAATVTEMVKGMEERRRSRQKQPQSTSVHQSGAACDSGPGA